MGDERCSCLRIESLRVDDRVDVWNNNEDRNALIAACYKQRNVNNRPHRLMKRSSIAVETSRLFSHFMQITQPSTSHVSRPFWQCVIFCVSVSYFASFLRVFCLLCIPSAFGKIFVSWYLHIYFSRLICQCFFVVFLFHRNLLLLHVRIKEQLN